MERFAFDYRSSLILPIVSIDPISGSESAEKLTNDFATFFKTVGYEFCEN